MTAGGKVAEGTGKLTGSALGLPDATSVAAAGPRARSGPPAKTRAFPTAYLSLYIFTLARIFPVFTHKPESRYAPCL